MSLLDREYFKEDHQRREEKYNGDFSLNSKPNNIDKKQSNNTVQTTIDYKIDNDKPRLTERGYEFMFRCEKCRNNIIVYDKQKWHDFSWTCPICNTTNRERDKRMIAFIVLTCIAVIAFFMIRTYFFY